MRKGGTMDYQGLPIAGAPPEAILRCLEEAQGVSMLQFQQIVNRTASLLLIHGLGQTLAFIQGRGGDRASSPYDILFRHLSTWLHTRLSLPQEDALRVLTEGDSRLYLEASREAGTFIHMLRKALSEVPE